MGNTMLFTLLGRDRVSRVLRNVGDEADRTGLRMEASNARSGKSFSALLPKLGAAALSVGKWAGIVGTAVPVAANLVATLVNIAPAAGLAATGILAAGSAFAALKIGMSGVGDAVKYAFDPTKTKQFDQALKKLSPNARSFVRELRSAGLGLTNIKRLVQDRMFDGLDKQLKATASATLPIFKRALLASAGALNSMGRGVAGTVQSLASSGALGQALDSANAGLVNLAGAPGLVVQGLGQIAAAAGPSFERLTEAGSGAMDKLSGALTKGFKSGGMQKAIEGAISLIGQLVTVGANVAKIIGGIFSAAQTQGGGMLGVLQKVTAEFAKLVNTKGVQDGLKAIFGTMAQLGTTVAPLLGQALSALGPVFAALGPPAQLLVRSLGSALSPIIAALGPALVAAATAVGSLVTALAPLLPVVGRVAAQLILALAPVLTTLAGVFTKLAPVIAQVAGAIGPILTPVISALSGVLTELVTQGAYAFLNALTALLPVIPQLIPLGVQLGQSLAQILVALTPLLPQITLLSTQLLTQLMPAILPLLPPLITWMSLLMRLATGVIIGIVIPAMTRMVAYMGTLQRQMQPAITAVKAVTKAMAAAFQWLYDHLIGHSVIPDLVNGIVRWFASLPRRAAGALAGLGGAIAGKAAAAGASMLSAIKGKLDSAVSLVRGLPGRAQSALGNLGGKLAGAGRSLISGLISGITSKIPSVKSVLSDLTGKLSDWKGPKHKDAQLLTPAGRLLIKGLIAGIDVSIASLKSKLGQVTNLIARAMDINKGNRHKVRGLGALSSLVERDNKKLLSLAAQRDKIAATIVAAKKFATDTASTARGTAALSALGEDSLTAGGGGIKNALQGKLAQIQQFQRYISILAKNGLNKGLLRQILEMGPEAGFAYASTLAGSSKAMIKQINGVQSKIDKASTSLGRSGADVLYDSGKNAGKGFLAGLEGQQKAIENLMIKIAKGMQKAIRKALDINSPSRVMAWIGARTTDGLGVGAVSRIPALQRAMAKVSDAVAGTPLAFGQPAMGTAAAASGGGVTNVHFHIENAMDPIAVGREVRRVLLELKRVYGVNVNLGVS